MIIPSRIRNYIKGSYSFTFVAQLTILVCGLANSVVLANGLGVSGRGELGIAMLWPTLLANVGSLGLIESTLFFSSQGSNESLNAVFGNALVGTLILSAVFVSLGYVLLPVVLSAQSVYLIMISRAFLIFVPFGMLLGHEANILRAHLKIIHFNILRLIIPVGSLLVAITFLLLGHLSIEIVIVSHVCLGVMALIYGTLLLFGTGLITNIRINPSLMTKMLTYGIKVFLGTISSLANLRLDQVLLTTIVSPTEFGLYVVAAKLASISSMLAEVVTMVAVPKIGQAQDLSKRIAALISTFRKFWWLTVGLKILFSAAIPIALPLIYGADFAPAVPICLLLVLGSLFWDAKLLLAGGAQIINKPTYGSIAEGIAVVFTIVLLAFLIPTLGITGAAITSLVAYAISAFYLFWQIASLDGVSFWDLFIASECLRKIA
ncbi:MAG: oligosaccharide flippase family protein [Anaerolineae bacterium]|nr:oligosaccharide flippase family protein [Anaerolineae bacterium]